MAIKHAEGIRSLPLAALYALVIVRFSCAWVRLAHEVLF